jgi:4-hydroxythreonine-4-phosphate dehydrogenase
MYLDDRVTFDKHLRPRLALTLGDPAGIGPEVVLKALADPDVSKHCDVTVVGSRDLLTQVYTKLNLTKNLDVIANPAELSVLDVHSEGEIITGTGNAASGAASFAYMETAIAHTLSGKFDAIVTGPIAKSAWKAAGYNYPGQTELLAKNQELSALGCYLSRDRLTLTGHSALYLQLHIFLYVKYRRY